MRPRHEFDSNEAYQEYLRLYYAGQALLYDFPQAATNLSFEENQAKSAAKVATYLVKALYLAPVVAKPATQSIHENAVNPHQSKEELALKKELLLLMNHDIFTEDEKNRCTSEINKHDAKWLKKSIDRAKELIDLRSTKLLATDKQKELIKKLMKSHVVEEDVKRRILETVEQMSIAAATTTIDHWTVEIEERKKKEREVAA